MVASYRHRSREKHQTLIRSSIDVALKHQCASIVSIVRVLYWQGLHVRLLVPKTEVFSEKLPCCSLPLTWYKVHEKANTDTRYVLRRNEAGRLVRAHPNGEKQKLKTIQTNRHERFRSFWEKRDRSTYRCRIHVKKHI